MTTMRKWYRIFLLRWDSTVSVQSPVIPDWLDNKANWYETVERAEEALEIIINTNPKFYTILPVYEREF